MRARGRREDATQDTWDFAAAREHTVQGGNHGTLSQYSCIYGALGKGLSQLQKSINANANHKKQICNINC